MGNLPAWTERTPQNPPPGTFWPGRTSCPWWDWWCTVRCRDSALFSGARPALCWTFLSLLKTLKTYTSRRNIRREPLFVFRAGLLVLINGSLFINAFFLIFVYHNSPALAVTRNMMCRVSDRNKNKKKTNFDCVRTPMTSAYKSAMMCTLPVLGPQYLQWDQSISRPRHFQWVHKGYFKPKEKQTINCASLMLLHKAKRHGRVHETRIDVVLGTILQSATFLIQNHVRKVFLGGVFFGKLWWIIAFPFPKKKKD